MKTEDNKKTSQDKGKPTKKTETQEKSNKSQDIIAAMLGGTETGEEKKPRKRPYLHFKEFGLIIPCWAIVSVEKNEQFRTIYSNTYLMYEIVINRGLESSPNMPFGERALSWRNESVRDAKFEALVKTLVDHNYEMNEI